MVNMTNRIAAAILMILACVSVRAKEKPARPKILGIAGAHFYTTDMPAARKFYSIVVSRDLTCTMCEERAMRALIIALPSQQMVTFSSAPSPTPKDLLWEVTLATDNIIAMKKYLKASKIKIEEPLPDDAAAFTIKDAEGHRLGFVQVPAGWSPSNTDALRLMHTGFIVNDRPAEDHFYKDVLGFHTYWHGGRVEPKDDWVAMQVPDGTDWIEYMLNISPTANKHTIGVNNHMALGVVDIHATEKRLIADGWKSTEQPKVGRDGKWQLNLYDPDETRTEFMEFTPKEKPCCSEFNGTHPGPK
jgi:catechol 2,3-dioxygenase-like lactoylglutathione lyase family enzyme